MKSVIFFTIFLISWCVATEYGNGTCKPNIVMTGTREICTCDTRNVKRCETREEADARLICGLDGSVFDGCNWCDCDANGKIRGCTEMLCLGYDLEPCTVGKTYKTAGKNCLCGNDSQLNCT
jgi:hypothetical protein